jgi:hypothetical protein
MEDMEDMEEDYSNIFGCFMKVGFDPNLSEQEFEDIDNAFFSYIWGDKGISDILAKLKHEDYGKDLELALFEFNVKPSQDELRHIREIDYYRKKEKSIGIPVIVTDENFFNQSEEGRYEFLKQTILRKLDLLAAVVKRRKMDTRMELLKSDLQKLFDESGFFKQNLNTDAS